MTVRARVVLPELSGPKISTTRPRGSPRPPSAISRLSAPLEIDGITGTVSLSRRMIDPLPKFFSICPTAASSALDFAVRALSSAGVNFAAGLGAAAGFASFTSLISLLTSLLTSTRESDALLAAEAGVPFVVVFAVVVVCAICFFRSVGWGNPSGSPCCVPCTLCIPRTLRVMRVSLF